MKRKDGKYPHNYKKMVEESEFDRVQMILGCEGKPRKKIHEFAFTGMIKCGECGGFVTAENKIKINKGNKHIHRYTYYHCTKKKPDKKCSQPCIELKSLKEQIDLLLQKIQISNEFKKWVIKYLNSTRNKEDAERNIIHENLLKTLRDYEKQLAGLTKMRYKDMISDEEFLKEKNILKNEMDKIEKNLKNIGYDTGNFHKMTISIFEFAYRARKWFKKDNLKIQKQILASLGSNLVLKDKILSIEPTKPFFIVEKMLNYLKEKKDRLEPAKELDFTGQNPLLDPQYSFLCGHVNDVRTFVIKSGDTFKLKLPIIDKK
jgi:hypothetical protein